MIRFWPFVPALLAAVALAGPASPPGGEPLLRVVISPEARVKVDVGTAAPRLVQNRWTEFPMVIENAAGTTAPLVIESAQAMHGDDDGARDRWLKVSLRPDGPLNGAATERRTLRLWGRDAGKRAAVLQANAGQGTQDLGFRSDALVVFDIAPETTTHEEMRREASNLVDLILYLAQHEPTVHTDDLVALAWGLHDGWLRHHEPVHRNPGRLLDDARSAVTNLVERGAIVVVDADDAAPLALVRGLSRVVVARVLDAAGSARYFPQRVIPEGGVLTLSTGAGEISVPVKLTEPATIFGRLLESDPDRPYPGRLRALGADGVYRKGTRFAENPTLSEKSLLPFAFTGRGATYSLPFFYSDGTFEVAVPPSTVRLTMERGFEHPVVGETLDLAPGERREVTLRSTRFLDIQERGWISGDTHIHWSKNSWDKAEDIRLLRLVQRAEDLRVANNLTLKHHTESQNFIAPTAFPIGPIPGLCGDGFHAQQAEEYRNEEFYGHVILLNIRRLIQPVSTGSMGGGPFFYDWPPNSHAIREAHDQGGIAIEAHGLGRNNDVPINVAQGLSDSLDQLPPDDYYRFLDCGFRIPLSNGSDHPARVAGCCRVYVKVPQPFTYEGWIDGIRQNRTFTTSGPLLFLRAGVGDIGDVLDVPAGTTIPIQARAVSRRPLGRFEIVVNGEVIAATDTTATSAELAFTLRAAEGSWIVARASRGTGFNALDGPDIAHTSAIYIDVDGRPHFAAPAAEEWIARMEQHAADLFENGRFPSDAQRDEAVEHVRAGIGVYRALLHRHEEPRNPVD